MKGNSEKKFDTPPFHATLHYVPYWLNINAIYIIIVLKEVQLLYLTASVDP